MKLTKYMAKEIRYPNGEYILGVPAEIIDEGAFYRIDNTHIFDKCLIKSVELVGDRLTIHMKEKDVVVKVVPKSK